jgi:hypothetical protein
MIVVFNLSFAGAVGAAEARHLPTVGMAGFLHVQVFVPMCNLQLWRWNWFSLTFIHFLG